MGFSVAFYLIANRFGAWSPQEVNMKISVSTAIPWIGGNRDRTAGRDQ
jgi:hypothetical protein